MAAEIDDLLSDATIARLRDLIGDRTDAVVAIATPTGHMVWASEPGSDGMFGRQQADFEGHSQFEYIHPDDHDIFRRKLAAAVRGETVRYRIRVMAADGSWVEISSVAWDVQTSQGQRIVSIALPLEHG